jgi:hypothetical protein
MNLDDCKKFMKKLVRNWRLTSVEVPASSPYQCENKMPIPACNLIKWDMRAWWQKEGIPISYMLMSTVYELMWSLGQ